jgi:hypothetical protein
MCSGSVVMQTKAVGIVVLIAITAEEVFFSVAEQKDFLKYRVLII